MGAGGWAPLVVACCPATAAGGGGAGRSAGAGDSVPGAGAPPAGRGSAKRFPTTCVWGVAAAALCLFEGGSSWGAESGQEKKDGARHNEGGCFGAQRPIANIQYYFREISNMVCQLSCSLVWWHSSGGGTPLLTLDIS